MCIHLGCPWTMYVGGLQLDHSQRCYLLISSIISNFSLKEESVEHGIRPRYLSSGRTLVHPASLTVWYSGRPPFSTKRRNAGTTKICTSSSPLSRHDDHSWPLSMDDHVAIDRCQQCCGCRSNLRAFSNPFSHNGSREVSLRRIVACFPGFE